MKACSIIKKMSVSFVFLGLFYSCFAFSEELFTVTATPPNNTSVPAGDQSLAFPVTVTNNTPVSESISLSPSSEFNGSISATDNGCSGPISGNGGTCTQHFIFSAPTSASYPQTLSGVFKADYRTAAYRSNSISFSVIQPTLNSISISTTASSIAAGDTAQFTATCTYSNGQGACPALTWQSSNTASATINSSGLVTGVAVGSSGITASAGSITSPASTLTITNPVLTSISVSTTTPSIMPGQAAQFIAVCISSINTAITCPALNWQSSSAAVATINSSGVAIGVAAGSANIGASAGAIVSEPVNLTVTPRINISASSGSLMLINNQPGNPNGSGFGTIMLKNTSSTAITGIQVTGLSKTLSVADNSGCTAPTGNTFDLSPNASCVLTINSTNVGTDASASESITIAGQNSNTLKIPVSALSVIVMSPPLQVQKDGTQLLLVNGCGLPQVLQVINNSTTPITGVAAAASSSLSGTTVTNYCNGVTLSQGKICMIEVATNKAKTGNVGTIDITNSTNAQQINIATKVEAVNTTPFTQKLVQGDRVFYPDSTTKNLDPNNCNIVKVHGHVLSSSNVSWAISNYYQHHSVPYSDGKTPSGASHSTRGQVNTISIIAADQTRKNPPSLQNPDSAYQCESYTESYTPTGSQNKMTSINWYLPAICELLNSHSRTSQDVKNLCANAGNNILSTNSKFIAYSSTEYPPFNNNNYSSAWFVAAGEMSMDLKYNVLFPTLTQVICARQFTN